MGLKNANKISQFTVQQTSQTPVRLEHCWKLIFLTSCDFTSKVVSKYHPSVQNQKDFFTTEDASEDYYISQQAEKYLMKFSELNLSAESFEHLKNMIFTNRKTAFADLPPRSEAFQWHLLPAYFFTNISQKILDTTKSTLQPLNFCLREMSKKFIIKCACKTSCGNRFACKEHEYFCASEL